MGKGMSGKFHDLFLSPPERKLLVAHLTALGLTGGFLFAVYHQAALEAYKVYAEWLVFLFAAFAGGNALVHWSQRPVKPEAKK